MNRIIASRLDKAPGVVHVPDPVPDFRLLLGGQAFRGNAAHPHAPLGVRRQLLPGGFPAVLPRPDAGGRRGTPMPKAVAAELLDAYKGEGNVIKKRDDTHRMAQANKAFAHYAW